MTDTVNVPAVRFKGFVGNWKRQKFEKLYKKYSTKNDLTYGENEIISVANMYYKTNSYISDRSYLLTYNVFELGDIAYEGNRSKDFVYGRFVENTIGNGIVSHVFQVFRPIMSRYDLSFWKYAINNENLMRSVLSRSTKSSTMMTDLVANDFLNESFAVPSYEEQVLIGKTLSDIDNLITLQQKKYEKLQNVKKAMLTQMFPAPGATTPAVRFAGFTEPWELCQFSREVEFFSGLTYSPNDISTDGTLVIRSSNVKNSEIVDADNVYVKSVVVNVCNVRKGDIVVVVRNGSRSLIGKHAQIQHNMRNTVIGAFMTGIRSEQPAFINALLDTNQFSSEIEKNLGATINQITNGMFRDMRFMFPSIEEEVQIGNFFLNLDMDIALQRRKLEKLQNIKKACLDRMFV